MSFNKDGKRICDHCGKVMDEGYMIEDGIEHYCSDDCLHQHYSHEEYLEMYDNGEVQRAGLNGMTRLDSEMQV